MAYEISLVEAMHLRFKALPMYNQKAIHTAKPYTSLQSETQDIQTESYTRYNNQKQ